MIPIGFLTVFVINDKKIINQYMRNIIFVIIINLFLATIFYLLLRFINLNHNYITVFIIILWIILQFYNYKFNYFKNEPIVIDNTK